MVQRRSYVVLKDAQVLLSREEFASGMGQRLNTSDAALKVAQINPNEVDYARDTVHTATITMNPQLSHRVLNQNLIRLLRLVPNQRNPHFDKPGQCT